MVVFPTIRRSGLAGMDVKPSRLVPGPPPALDCYLLLWPLEAIKMLLQQQNLLSCQVPSPVSHFPHLLQPGEQVREEGREPGFLRSRVVMVVLL